MLNLDVEYHTPRTKYIVGQVMIICILIEILFKNLKKTLLLYISS